MKFGVMSRLVGNLDGWRVGGADWVDGLRESVHLWMAVPLGLAALTVSVPMTVTGPTTTVLDTVPDVW